MELELNRTHISGYDTVLDTTVFQEETLETIVPDACPDILRLVNTQGKVLMKGKTALDGRVTLTGTARLTVLYQPDGGTGPCGLEVGIPFSISVEEKSIHSGCIVVAVPRVVGADTRTMNPRKIMTRVEIAVHVKVFAASTAALCSGISAVDGTVEQLTQAHQLYCVSALQEKQVSFEDNLNIPTGRTAAEELLGSRVELICSDSKIIGNKLIFKGEAAVQLLYRSVGGGMDTADFSLPFSQITEVIGVGEDGVCDLEMCLLAADFTLGADGRTISVALTILAQAVVHEVRSVVLLADAYSTCCKINAEQASFEYFVCQTEGIGRQMVREIIEAGIQIKSVIDSYCAIGHMEQSRDADEIRLAAQAVVTAVCETEDGVCCAVSRSFDVSCGVEIPEGCVCRFVCRCENLIATPTADGVEVRFVLDFPYSGLKRMSAPIVRDVSVPDATDEAQGCKPSIILRVLQDGEQLWNVAKRYGTTIADIVKANELESERPDAGTLLLIPRKR